jgi:hypothetical protein
VVSSQASTPSPRHINPERAGSDVTVGMCFMMGGVPMPLDRSFIERNRASTNRIRALVARVTDAELHHPVGEHWTVAITLAHLALWDRRMLYLLDQTEWKHN